MSEELNELQKLLGKAEELDPELEAWTSVSDEGWTMIRHPLVYSILHTPELNALVNEGLRQKKEQLRRAQATRNWSQYVFLHERPYRINAFSRICHRMGDARYWELLGNIWTDTENLWQSEKLWKECLAAERRYRSHLMSLDERAALAHDIQAHGQVVYRGFTRPNRQRGLSWTTNKVVAKFFARRFARPDDKKLLATGKVDRRDIIAYFEGRSEYEVVVLPKHVRGIEIQVVS